MDFQSAYDKNMEKGNLKKNIFGLSVFPFFQLKKLGNKTHKINEKHMQTKITTSENKMKREDAMQDLHAVRYARQSILCML